MAAGLSKTIPLEVPELFVQVQHQMYSIIIQTQYRYCTFDMAYTCRSEMQSERPSTPCDTLCACSSQGGVWVLAYSTTHYFLL